jgi:hypothetical protein
MPTEPAPPTETAKAQVGHSGREHPAPLGWSSRCQIGRSVLPRPPGGTGHEIRVRSHQKQSPIRMRAMQAKIAVSYDWKAQYLLAGW